jgi:hypothetical protein
MIHITIEVKLKCHFGQYMTAATICYKEIGSLGHGLGGLTGFWKSNRSTTLSLPPRLGESFGAASKC